MSWPDDVLEQLFKFDPSILDVEIPTIGPKFSSDTPRAEIADDYRVQLRALLRDGFLEESSSFVIGLLTRLDAVSQNPDSTEDAFEAKPSAGLESEILAAVRLSLQNNRRR